MKSVFSFGIAVALGVSATVGAAVWQGQLSQRWNTAASVTGAVESVERLPRELGDWRVSDEVALDKAVVDTLQCHGYVNRVYTHRRTGDQLYVTLLVGPPGPMTVHTPELCLRSRGIVPIGEPDRFEFQYSNVTGRVFRTTFEDPTPGAPRIEILYGWNDQGRWDAPDAARFAYGGRPLLYKIQVASKLWPNVAAGNDGIAARFLTELINTLPRDFGNLSHESQLGAE